MHLTRARSRHFRHAENLLPVRFSLLLSTMPSIDVIRLTNHRPEPIQVTKTVKVRVDQCDVAKVLFRSSGETEEHKGRKTWTTST
jgi:hypothetical protein